MPRVTVIIPTYNWSAVLPYSIGSVLRQTFGDFALLVVGDGCADDSEAVVAAVGDPRVRWINLAENSRHQSAPNNEGLRQARGEIIAYLGHDDLWLPHHLSSHVQALDARGADLAYSLCMNVTADESSIWPAIPRPCDGRFSPPAAMTHRRGVTEELGGWRDYRSVEAAGQRSPDVELWRRAQAAGRVFTFVPRWSAIKFPASWRRDVYRRRPSHEQARWLARIDAEPRLESELLVESIASEAMPSGVPYRDLLRQVFRQTIVRLRRRLALRTLLFRKGTIEEARRFKGL